MLSCLEMRFKRQNRENNVDLVSHTAKTSEDSKYITRVIQAIMIKLINFHIISQNFYLSTGIVSCLLYHMDTCIFAHTLHLFNLHQHHFHLTLSDMPLRMNILSLRASLHCIALSLQSM